MISNKREKIKQELASLCIKSGYQPGFTLGVTRNVNVVKGPPHRKEDIASSRTGHPEHRTPCARGSLYPNKCLMGLSILSHGTQGRRESRRRKASPQKSHPARFTCTTHFSLFSLFPHSTRPKVTACARKLGEGPRKLRILRAWRQLPLDHWSTTEQAGLGSESQTWHCLRASGQVHSYHTG